MFLLLLITFCYAQVVSNEQQYKADFLAYDSNQDGFIDPDEVRKHFSGIQSWEVSPFFIAADANEDGLITLEEYVSVSERHASGEVDLRDYKFY